MHEYCCHVCVPVYVHGVECFVSAYVGGWLSNCNLVRFPFVALNFHGLSSVKDSRNYSTLKFSHLSGMWGHQPEHGLSGLTEG